MTYTYTKTFRDNRKQLLVDCLGGKCAKCGYSQCLSALDFHHISNKDFTIAGKIQSLQKCIKEVKKCVLLCANCHRELHAMMWSLDDIVIPSFLQIVINDWNKRYTKIKKCELCGTPFMVNRSNTKRFCTARCRGLARRKVKRPIRTTLRKEMQAYTWITLGKKYGVSDSAVRKWAKNYQLI